MRSRALLKSLYVQVLIGIAAGVIWVCRPGAGSGHAPLGDGSSSS